MELGIAVAPRRPTISAPASAVRYVCLFVYRSVGGCGFVCLFDRYILDLGCCCCLGD